ncbi:MAG: DUF2062 domain-containing protein [Gammaproteobacteria bacterium]|nr:DUF2062 domain-containing protein [Gammaproteobacteria bacterium]
MPKRLFKKYLPDHQQLKEHKYLSWFGDHLLDPHLWHLSRRSLAGAGAVGIFCAFIPMPLQMIIAAGFAIIFRVNLPFSVALVWITNPLTMGPIYYTTYKLGAWMLNSQILEYDSENTFEWLVSVMDQIWQPLLLGSFATGAILATIAYYGILWIWGYQVLKKYKNRHI